MLYRARLVTLFFVVFSVLSAPNLSVMVITSSAQEELPAGYAVRDVTDLVGCSITIREHGSIKDPESSVLSEWVEGCPYGSVIETTSVGSEAEADALGAIFIPSTGAPGSDDAALQEVKWQLAPAPDTSEDALACTFYSKSKTMSINVYVEGITAYSRAYYWRDSDCSSGLSSGAAWLGASSSKIKWVKYIASPPYSTDSHGCQTLSTSSKSDTYNVALEYGGIYQDEVRSTAYACSTGIGTSYTNTMPLS